MRAVKLERIRNELVAKGNAARQVLRDFGVKTDFWNLYKETLTSDGLEIPDWVVAAGRKVD